MLINILNSQAQQSQPDAVLFYLGLDDNIIKSLDWPSFIIQNQRRTFNRFVSFERFYSFILTFPKSIINSTMIFSFIFDRIEN